MERLIIGIVKVAAETGEAEKKTTNKKPESKNLFMKNLFCIFSFYITETYIFYHIIHPASILRGVDKLQNYLTIYVFNSIVSAEKWNPAGVGLEIIIVFYRPEGQKGVRK